MEEQARLVWSRDSEGSGRNSFGSLPTMAYTEDRLSSPDGSGDPSANVNVHHNEADNGSLLDYETVPQNLHEDALGQAGFGLAQIRAIIATSLAVLGSSLELSAIPFILPSAEIELCILQHEKNWLVLISLVGCCIGSLCWGAAGSQLGRRRALLSCMAVNAIFAAIAAFMPTYGTFMMARFCSSIGSSGTTIAGYTLLIEYLPKKWRIMAAFLPLSSGVGALLAAQLATVILPQTGADAIPNNADHFTPWHRYLLICVVPILASLISLLWTLESPRFLLEVGKDVDAMLTYQNIHETNQFSFRVRAQRNTEVNTLSELALPAKRPHNYNKPFWHAYLQLFSTSYRMMTFKLGGVLVFTMAIQFYLASYIPAIVERTENEIFEASRISIQNTTYSNSYYNRTLENVIFTNVSFQNCTFKDILMSHVVFENCTFLDSDFSNIKTTYTEIQGSLFVNCSIIDTDMEYGREIDYASILNSTIIRGMRSDCSRHFHLTTKLGGLVDEQTYGAAAMLAAAVVAFAPYKYRMTAVLCVIMFLLSPSIYLCQNETALYIIESVYRFLCTLAFFNTSVTVVEQYPANMRCTAHGVMVSVALAVCTAARGSWPANAIFAAAMLAVAAASAAVCALTRQ